MNISWQGLVIIALVFVVMFGVRELVAVTKSLHKAQAEVRRNARVARPAREHPEDIPEN